MTRLPLLQGVKNNYPEVLMRERCVYYLIQRASDFLKIDLHLRHDKSVSKMERSVLEDLLLEKMRDDLGRQQLGDLIAECQNHHKITEVTFSHGQFLYEFS